MRRLAAALLLAALAFPQEEEIPGARVTFRVVGTDGKPLSAVRVQPTGGDQAARVTDEAGVVRFELLVPGIAMPSAFGWEIEFDLTLDSYAPCRTGVRPFRGAQIERAVLLRRKRTMRIDVRGPGDEPVRSATARLSWRSPDHGGTEVAEAGTDGAGVLSFDYAEGVERVDLVVGGWSGRLRPAETATIHLAARDLPSKEEAAPPAPKGPALAGVLLHHDGRPARNWFVTGQVTCWGGGGAMGFMTSFYDAAGLQRVDDEGRFSTTPTSGILAVFSPEGLAVLYGVNPSSWEGRPHRTTLRLPPAAEPLRGAVVGPDGRPVAGAAVVPERHPGSSPFDSWWISAKDAPFAFVGSDADGTFVVPLLRGQDFSFDFRKEGYEGWRRNDTGEGPVVLLPKPTRRARMEEEARARHVVIDVRDRAGRRIDRLSMYSWVPHRNGTGVGQAGNDYYQDALGLHIFVGAESREANGLFFNLESPGWATYEVNLPLTDGLVQEVKLVWPGEMRQRPLRGRLLGTSGEPVPGCVVTVLGAAGWILGLECTTDEEGDFAFPYAPRPCRLDFDGATSRLRLTRLPGWARERTIAADEEEVVVRLERCGSVKVLLPKGYDAPSAFLHLVRDDDGKDWGDSLEAAEEPDVLVVSQVRPGDYRFGSSCQDATIVELGLKDRGIHVEAGKETVVDLRRLRVVPRPEPIWHEVTCTEKGRPVSGADVWVFADSEGTGGVVPLARDLTDDAGRVRFQTSPGRGFYVVANCAGRFTGCVAPVSDAKATTLVLRPARTLRVRSQNQPVIQFPGLEGGLCHAVAQAMGLAPLEDGPSIFAPFRSGRAADAPWQGFGVLRAAASGEFIAYDLPVGLRCRVSVEGGPERETTIEPGVGDQILALDE